MLPYTDERFRLQSICKRYIMVSLVRKFSFIKWLRVSMDVELSHRLYSDSASPKPGKMRRVTLITFVVTPCG